MINPDDYYERINSIKDEDFRQDMFLKLLTAAPKFKGSSLEFDKYLSTMIRNAKIDNTEYNQLHKLPSLDEPNEFGEAISNYIPDTTNLEKQIEAKNILEQIKQNTDNRTFRILELYFEEGYTAEEIKDKYPELKIRNAREIYNLVARFRAGDLSKKHPEITGTVYQFIEDNYSALMQLAYIAEVIPKSVLSNQFIYSEFLELNPELPVMDRYQILGKSHSMSVIRIRVIIQKLKSQI